MSCCQSMNVYQSVLGYMQEVAANMADLSNQLKCAHQDKEVLSAKVLESEEQVQFSTEKVT